MVRRWSNVPGISSSQGPSRSIIGTALMDKALCAGWDKGIRVEIKDTRDSGVGRQFWIVSALTEEVQGEFGLRK